MMEELKTTDLMVGDFVRYTEDQWETDEDKAPHTITCIGKPEYPDNMPFIKIEGSNERYHIGLFEPIPLTAEILQKNGFSIKEGGYIMTLAIEDTFTMNLDDEYGQHKWSIIITNGPWNIKIKVFGMLAISIVIHYVHELQHALRLGGLTEVADNLKIYQL